MTGRLLTIALVMLPCIFGAHLSAALLGFVAVLIVTAHLLPFIAAGLIVGAVLVLASLIASTLWRNGGGLNPIGRTA